MSEYEKQAHALIEEYRDAALLGPYALAQWSENALVDVFDLAVWEEVLRLAAIGMAVSSDWEAADG